MDEEYDKLRLIFIELAQINRLMHEQRNDPGKVGRLFKRSIAIEREFGKLEIKHFKDLDLELKDDPFLCRHCGEETW